jgi:hypothetical protein
MHQYLDTDGSGTNATCLSPAIGAQRLSAATEWLQENGYKGFLGEIGAGNNGQLSSLLGVIRFAATDTTLSSLQTSVPRLSTSHCAAWPSRVPGWASAGGLLVPGGGTCPSSTTAEILRTYTISQLLLHVDRAWLWPGSCGGLPAGDPALHPFSVKRLRECMCFFFLYHPLGARGCTYTCAIGTHVGCKHRSMRERSTAVTRHIASCLPPSSARARLGSMTDLLPPELWQRVLHFIHSEEGRPRPFSDYMRVCRTWRVRVAFAS